MCDVIEDKNGFGKLRAQLAYKRQCKKLVKVFEQLENSDLSDNLSQHKVVRDLQVIDKKLILNQISMAEMPLIVYLLSLKYNGKIDLLPFEKDAAIIADGLAVANMSYLAVYIHFMKVRDNVLHIEGNISQPTVLKERCRFGIKNNDVDISCQMFDRGLDLKKGMNTYETRTAYVADIPLSTEGNNIVFSNYVDGNECVYGKINSMRFAPIADCIKNQYCVMEHWFMYIEGNVLHCELAEESKVAQKEELFRKELRLRYPQKAEWAIELREESFTKLKEKRKPIWLFMDRIDRADDNAEALFRYVRKNKEIDSYFIIQQGTAEYDRLVELGNIVPLYSRQHFALVLQADCIISSQSNGVVENPFWEDAELFRDLYHRSKIVFLQHGVIKDDMSITLSRYNTHFAGFVTSSQKEWKSILDYPYYYTEKEVWLTGLPRFDRLYNNPKKYVLIMPTWRQGLMMQKWDEKQQSMVWKVRDDFLNSEYFKRYLSLISNTELQNICLQNGYRLVFMPHALMEPYINYFMKDDNCIYWNSSKSYRDAFAEGNILITDYSSVAFDFAYLNKPVIYYQFDKEKFFSEHTYKQGYFDYEKDGLGEVVYTEDKLLSTIIIYLKNQCRLQDKYLERIKNTFAFTDNNNCERVFECLSKM